MLSQHIWWFTQIRAYVIADPRIFNNFLILLTYWSITKKWAWPKVVTWPLSNQGLRHVVPPRREVAMPHACAMATSPLSAAADGVAGRVVSLDSRVVTCSYAGYAKHGYATWLCHMWLRRLCQNLVTPRIVMSVTPYTVTPRGYAGYAKFGYATWLRYAWSCRLRHTRLLHMVTLPRPISRSHWKFHSLHDIRNIVRQQKITA